MTLHERDEAVTLHTYRRLAPEFVRGEGMYLYDRAGRRYLDFYCGIAVNILGHRHPGILRAMEDQMGKFLHLSNNFVAEAPVALAEELTQTSFASKVFFANSGTEANEAMLKLARKYGTDRDPEKYRIVAVKGGFHGRTSGSLALTGNPRYSDPFGPLLPGVTHVEAEDLRALEEAVDDTTAGIILELIQGEGGIHPVSQAYADKAHELAEKHDALLLIDEIQTGLLRTGSLYAYQQYDITPDAMTLAKGLGGGLPIGALLVGDRAAGVLGRGDHGSTFGSNPVACAAGHAVMKVLTEQGFQEQVRTMAALLKEGLDELQRTFPDRILEVRGRGLMLGVEVAGDLAGKIPERALDRGVLINVTSGTVLRLLPALILTEKDVEHFLTVLADCLKED